MLPAGQSRLLRCLPSLVRVSKLVCRPAFFTIVEGSSGAGTLAFENTTFLYDYCLLPVWKGVVQACVNSADVRYPHSPSRKVGLPPSPLRRLLRTKHPMPVRPCSASMHTSGIPGRTPRCCTLQVAAVKLPDGTYEFICTSCTFEGASSEERFLALGPSARVNLTDSTIKCLAMVEDELDLERAQSLLGLGATPMQAGRCASPRVSVVCSAVHACIWMLDMLVASCTLLAVLVGQDLSQT